MVYSLGCNHTINGHWWLLLPPSHSQFDFPFVSFILPFVYFYLLSGVVLAVGNALNAGTGRGEAYGFQIGSLEKLRDTKTSNANMTLIHFIAQKVCFSKYCLDVQFYLSVHLDCRDSARRRH